MSTLSPTAGLLATPPGQQAHALWYWCPSLNVGDENSGTLGCAWGTAICIRENSVSSSRSAGMGLRLDLELPPNQNGLTTETNMLCSVSLPSVPQNLGPKPTCYIKEQRKTMSNEFHRLEKTRGH